MLFSCYGRLVRRHLLILALVCLPLFAESAALAVPSGRIPPYIASRYGPTSDAAWISARSVLNSKGELNLEALPPGLRIAAQRQIESGDYQKQGCIQTLQVNVELPPDLGARGTLGDLARNSLAILRGTVTAIDQGFGSYGTAALLLEVQVDERVKGSVKIVDAPYVYVEYPVASFEAGGYRFCKKDSRWPEPPEIGDRLMLFPYMPPGDEGGQVIAPFPDAFEVIFERKRDGALALPKALRGASDLVDIKRLETMRERTLGHLESAQDLDR